MITLFTTDRCPKCKLTKRKLEDMGVEYIEILANELDREMLKEKGFMEFPVIVMNDWEDSWSGYRVDKLNDLKVECVWLDDFLSKLEEDGIDTSEINITE